MALNRNWSAPSLKTSSSASSIGPKKIVRKPQRNASPSSFKPQLGQTGTRTEPIRSSSAKDLSAQQEFDLLSAEQQWWRVEARRMLHAASSLRSQRLELETAEEAARGKVKTLMSSLEHHQAAADACMKNVREAVETSIKWKSKILQIQPHFDQSRITISSKRHEAERLRREVQELQDQLRVTDLKLELEQARNAKAAAVAAKSGAPARTVGREGKLIRMTTADALEKVQARRASSESKLDGLRRKAKAGLLTAARNGLLQDQVDQMKMEKSASAPATSRRHTVTFAPDDKNALPKEVDQTQSLKTKNANSVLGACEIMVASFESGALASALELAFAEPKAGKKEVSPKQSETPEKRTSVRARAKAHLHEGLRTNEPKAGQDAAAIKIQKVHRGNANRKKVAKEKGGSAQAKAKLTSQQTEQINKLMAAGEFYEDIVNKLGTHDKDLVRQYLKDHIRKEDAEKAATKIQAAQRGKADRKKVTKQREEKPKNKDSSAPSALTTAQVEMIGNLLAAGESHESIVAKFDANIQALVKRRIEEKQQSSANANKESASDAKADEAVSPKAASAKTAAKKDSPKTGKSAKSEASPDKKAVAKAKSADSKVKAADSNAKAADSKTNAASPKADAKAKSAKPDKKEKKTPAKDKKGPAEKAKSINDLKRRTQEGLIAAQEDGRLRESFGKAQAKKESARPKSAIKKSDSSKGTVAVLKQWSEEAGKMLPLGTATPNANSIQDSIMAATRDAEKKAWLHQVGKDLQDVTDEMIRQCGDEDWMMAVRQAYAEGQLGPIEVKRLLSFDPETESKRPPSQISRAKQAAQSSQFKPSERLLSTNLSALRKELRSGLTTANRNGSLAEKLDRLSSAQTASSNS